ncbi:Oxygen-independent coproporphyrinogen-III oxidase [Rickettsiales bacterium Ac37b]|nr:Oxygen-independent coproporphyrinogen-III oxidase [Rickettsiales bacterium Ac37b]
MKDRLVLNANEKSELAVYIHWPFCVSKCPYCDFNSHVRDSIEHEEWLKAYLAEIEYFTEILHNSRIKTIFFGGGTPSLMPPVIVSKILDKLVKFASCNEEVEITLEANPSSVDRKNFYDFKQAGVNRLSLGVQALNDQDLLFLGRKHTMKDALSAIDLTSQIFSNFSFDLIYARPEQTLENWQIELEIALTMASNHLSLYQLTIEKGTAFYNQYKNKQFIMPDDDYAADMYQLTRDLAGASGFMPYEISNYALSGKECEHNLMYWRYQNYLGIGPGAHSRINGKAIMMTHSPENWLNQVLEQGHGIQSLAELTILEQLDEMLLMGLRLYEGIKLREFQDRFSKNISQLLNQNILDYLCDEHLLHIDQTHIRATSKGLLLLDRIIPLLKR